MRVGCAPRPSVDPGSVIPGTRYRALRQIGASAGGVVYEVEHLELGRRFALRVLPADLAQRASVVRRARADWQALARLRHPHIARVTDAGVTARGTPYAVTEQLPGETLRQRLTRRRRVSVPEALGIARELASALAAAHAIGVVHGNVAAHNILLTSAGCSKLCDFGNYEGRATGGPPDQHADVHGLGLVLFEMVAGRPALEVPRGRRGTHVRRIGGRAPLLAEVVPGVADAVSEIVARLLGREPSECPRLAAVIVELGRLQRRYEGQVSTTQETAHYVTRRLSCLVGAARSPSEVGVIVPLPSQTLEGIPWTVITSACADRTGVAGVPPVALPLAAESTRSPRRTPAPSPRPRPARAASSGVPRAPVPPRGVEVRLLLVMACSLLTGVLVASLVRRSAPGESSVSAAGAGVARSLPHGGRSAAGPACSVRSGR